MTVTRIRLVSGVVFTAALVLAIVIYLGSGPERKLVTTVAAETITHSTDHPTETKPGPDYNWKGKSTDPKKVIMPTIGVDAYIQNVGVDQHNQVAVPSNINMAGWFIQSVRPGDTGLSILDGHVDGTQNPGVFTKLRHIKQGDRYSIEFGNGSLKNFVVTSISTVTTKDAASVLFSQDPEVKQQVNLITCTGGYNRQAHQYDLRLIVASKAIN